MNWKGKRKSRERESEGIERRETGERREREERVNSKGVGRRGVEGMI